MEVIQTEYKARVTNLSTRPYEEFFKGQKVTFQPGESQEWDWSEAVQFKGQFIPVQKNDTGQYLNEKRIKVEKIIDPMAPKKVVGFQNPLTGTIFATEDEMKAELNQTKANYSAIKSDDSGRVDALAKDLEATKDMVKGIMGAVQDLSKAFSSQSTVSKRGRKKVDDDANGTDGRSS
jgi:hypothetical protein